MRREINLIHLLDCCYVRTFSQLEIKESVIPDHLPFYISLASFIFLRSNLFEGRTRGTVLFGRENHLRKSVNCSYILSLIPLSLFPIDFTSNIKLLFIEFVLIELRWENGEFGVVHDHLFSNGVNSFPNSWPASEILAMKLI